MAVNKTLYLDEASKRKQLTMPAWAVSSLKSGLTLTKGLVAYEVLMLSGEARDSLSRVEDRLIDELDAEVDGDTRKAFDDVIESRISATRTDLTVSCEYDDASERIENVNIHLPASIVDDLPGRGLGDTIAKSLVYAAASPWSSRVDRIEDLQSLITYVRTESLPDDASEFVRAVVSGQNDDYDVYGLHDLISPGVEWWEREDLDKKTLCDRADEVPVTPEARSKALATVVNNDDVSYAHNGLVSLAIAYYRCTRETANKYADIAIADIHSETYSVQFEEDIEVIAETSRSGRAMNAKFKLSDDMLNDDWKLCGFKSDASEFCGLYTSIEDATDAVKSALDLLKNSDKLPEPVKINRDNMHDILKSINKHNKKIAEERA